MEKKIIVQYSYNEKQKQKNVYRYINVIIPNPGSNL